MHIRITSQYLAALRLPRLHVGDMRPILQMDLKVLERLSRSKLIDSARAERRASASPGPTQDVTYQSIHFILHSGSASS